MHMSKLRTVVYFDPPEREALEKLSQQTGAPITALVRKAVIVWLKTAKKGKS